MKKIFISCVAVTLAFVTHAQDPTTSGVILDALEDTTNVVTIADIISVQEMVTTQNSTDAHFNSVWSRNSYFNLGYNSSSKLSPKEDILSGLNETQMVAPFKSDWGMSLTLGHNYRLHKKAIANTVQFYIDWTYINLHVNHFKAAEGDKVYDSNLEWTETNKNHSTDTYNFIPWNMEKYEFNYSMQLGPSLTIAPFTYVRSSPGLHFLKFNIYWHIGYEVSMLLFNNDPELDVNPGNTTTNKGLTGSSKQNWGLGLTNTFGLTMNWKSIGFGWETSSCNLKYQSLQKDLFGSDKYKFKQSTSRIFLQIRY